MRGVFWIVAALVATHIVIALTCLGMCVYYSEAIVAGKYKCDPQGKCMAVLQSPFTFLNEFVNR